MTPAQKDNLLRLLKPRHVAAIGGRDVEVVATECARRGFDGPFWPVNPKRDQIGGHHCFASVDDLPEAPDAIFLAVPKEPAIETLAKLSQMGAGGVVCYTAGFGEMGEEGAKDEARLIEAAGDMALIGPNCYGMINYVDQVALWPFAHGGTCPGYGAAIVTQSGMLSSDLTMSQRSVPFAYMVSAGNQSILQLDDFVDLFADLPEVKVIGLHIEGLKDVPAFERAALKALEKKIPIVALKTGTSSIGSELTVSHTGSLSGADDLYEALFDRLGIIRVFNPSQLLETCKFISVAGLPSGKRVGGFTCSGGGATMLADYGEKVGLEFPRPSETVQKELPELLPHTATLSNPLDYTTPIWGFPEKTLPVFASFLSDNYDATVIIQDYPAPGLDESKIYYSNDARSFLEAAKLYGTPAAVCSTIPENMDQETREFLVSKGVAPMQGLMECLDAISAAAWYNQRRNEISEEPLDRLLSSSFNANNELIDEYQGKQLLKTAGLQTPSAKLSSSATAGDDAVDVGFPVVVKMVHASLAHKSEVGAVALNLNSMAEVERAVAEMQNFVGRLQPDALSDNFLVEKMVEKPVAELLVSVRKDPQFGWAMTLASGGVMTELLADAATLLLPASKSDFSRNLAKLKIDKLLDGFRGGAKGDKDALLDALLKLQDLVMKSENNLSEIEINPLFVMAEGCVVVDALIQQASVA